MFAPSFVRVDNNSPTSTSRAPASNALTSGFAASQFTDVTLFRDRSTSDSGYAPFLDSLGSGDGGSVTQAVPLAKGTHVTVYPVANEADSVWIVKEEGNTPTAQVSLTDPRSDKPNNREKSASSEKKRSPKRNGRKTPTSPKKAKSPPSNHNSAARRKKPRDAVEAKERALQRLDDVIVHERPTHLPPASSVTRSPASPGSTDFLLDTLEECPKSPRKRSPLHNTAVTSPTNAHLSQPAAVRLASFSAVMAPTLTSNEHVTSNGHSPPATTCNGNSATVGVPHHSHQYSASPGSDSQPYQYSTHSPVSPSSPHATSPHTDQRSPVRSPPTSPNGGKSPPSPECDSGSIYHQPLKDVDVPSAKRLAKRLYNLEGFKKSDISKHLSKK